MFKTRKCITIVLVFLSVCGCKETILHDLGEDQANQVKIALSQSGIEAEKQREGASWNLAVPSSQVNQALRAVETTRILNRSTSRKVPERSNSLLQTAEDRARIHEQELSAHLEKTLERFPGVLEARVHLNLSVSRSISLLDDAEGNSASVLLVTRTEAQVPQADIQRIVAGASGITVEEISVIVVASIESEAKASRLKAPKQLESAVVAKVKEELKGDEDTIKNSASGFSIGDSRFSRNVIIAPAVGVLLTCLFLFRKYFRSKTASAAEDSDLLRPPNHSCSLTPSFPSEASDGDVASSPVSPQINGKPEKNVRHDKVLM